MSFNIHVECGMVLLMILTRILSCDMLWFDLPYSILLWLCYNWYQITKWANGQEERMDQLFRWGGKRSVIRHQMTQQAGEEVSHVSADIEWPNRIVRRIESIQWTVSQVSSDVKWPIGNMRRESLTQWAGVEASQVSLDIKWPIGQARIGFNQLINKESTDTKWSIGRWGRSQERNDPVGW